MELLLSELIVTYFLFQGLQGKAGAKGSKGEVVSIKTKRRQTPTLKVRLG